MIGMMMSLTRESTIFPNAAPMMTPMARSTTFPLIANSLNSLSIFSPPGFGRDARRPEEFHAPGTGNVRGGEAENKAEPTIGKGELDSRPKPSILGVGALAP